MNGKILPFSAVEAVQLFRMQEPLFHRRVLRVEFHKFPLVEGVETGNVRAHSVGGYFGGAQMEREGLAILRAFVGKTVVVQGDDPLADDFTCLLVF